MFIHQELYLEWLINKKRYEADCLRKYAAHNELHKQLMTQFIKNDGKLVQGEDVLNYSAKDGHHWLGVGAVEGVKASTDNVSYITKKSASLTLEDN